MRMRAQNPSNRTGRSGDQGLDVCLEQRTRVDDSNALFGIANQIAVGARPCHHAGIGSG